MKYIFNWSKLKKNVLKNLNVRILIDQSEEAFTSQINLNMLETNT